MTLDQQVRILEDIQTIFVLRKRSGRMI